MVKQINSVQSGVRNLNDLNVVVGLEEYARNADLSAVELFRDYPVPLLQFASVCCILFMIIGVPGNLITVLALTKYKQVQNATAVFIIHLSITDMLFCCIILPLVAVSFWARAWVHGKFICHLFPLLNYVLVIVSLLTVLAITINRYVLICHPKIYVKLYTTTNITIMLTMIWAFSLILLLMPFFEVWGRFSLDPHVGSCTIVPDRKDRNPKKFIVFFVVAFVCVTMLFCYARIIWTVKKTSSKRNKSKSTRFEMQNMNVGSSETSAQIVTLSTSSDSHASSTGTESTDNESDNCFTDIDLNPNSDNNDHTGAKRKNIHVKPRMSNKKGLPSKRDKKLKHMVTAIMVCFCICYLPITLTKILYKSFNTYHVTNILGYLTIYLTPCVNPIIYVLMSKEYRIAYKSLFSLKRQH